MAKANIRLSDTLWLRLPQSQEKEAGLKPFPARRRQKVRSVVDDTFAALPIRKHAQIEQLIEQTKYGE